MNTLKIEEKLSKKYKYKPLPDDLSQKYRCFYIDNIPGFLNINGSDEKIYTKCNSLLANGYDRIVIGDYGAFIEFDKSKSNEDIFVIQKGQEYRVNNKKYSENVKYVWMTINDGSNVKIYLQRKKVNYADYLLGKYYVSVHEILIF